MTVATVSAQSTTRQSVDSSGNEGNSGSYASGISADGNVVAFYSDASNLVSGDLNGKTDAFVRVRSTGITERVSVDSSGLEANGPSYSPAVSADGMIVAFYSDARNLVSGDTNRLTDVFVHDRGTGATTRVSVDSSGMQSDGASYSPQISADGMIVTYYSFATNLVANDLNGAADIFVYDRATGITTRVSVDSGGAEANGGSYSPRISADGRFIFYYSDATNLVANDTNGVTDGFVYDRVNGTTERVTVDSSGNEGNDISYNGTITADGGLVAFYSLASNLIATDTNGFPDVFVHDRTTGVTFRVSEDSSGREGNNGSFTARISADGKFVAFASDASNLVSSDTNGATDILRKELATGTIIRLSVDTAGNEANGVSSLPWNSADGRFTTFSSTATNLVANDTNGVSDAFLRDACIAATATNYGTGWPGTLGVPTLTSSAPPVLGSSITVTLSNSLGSTTAALLILGFTQASIPTSADGTLLVIPTLLIPLSVPASGLGLSGTVPSDPAVCGVEIDLQGLEADSGASKGISFTDGLALVLGL